MKQLSKATSGTTLVLQPLSVASPLFAAGGVMLGKISVGPVGQLVFARDLLIMLQETSITAVRLQVQGAVLHGMLD